MKIDRISLNYGREVGIVVPRRLLYIMGWDEAAVVAYFVHKWKLNGGKQWFFCSTEELMEECCLSKGDHDIVMRKLVRKYVRSEKRGLPSKRVIRIDVDKVDEEVQYHLKLNGHKKTKKQVKGPVCDNLLDQSSKDPITLLFHNKVNIKQSTISKRSTSENDNEFISHKNKNKVRHQDVDLARAEALAKGLSRRNKILVSYSTKRWANEFAKLRDKDGIENETISSVLNWYIENIGEKYIPQAYSAKAFRSKFPRLAERAEKTKPVVVCEEVKELARQLQMYHEWPKGTKGDVPEALQICYNNYIIFWDKLKSNIKKLNKTNFPKTKKSQRDRLRSYYQYLLKAMPNNLKFAEQWMMHVNAMICGWDKWQGELKSMAWNGNMTNKRFNAFALSFDWGDTGTNWEYIKRIIAL